MITDDDVPRRTPKVTIELQLWPPPPRDAHPNFCYLDQLNFYDPDTIEHLWEQKIPILRHGHPLNPSKPARVVQDDNFGWILQLVYTHDEARRMLAHMNLPTTPNTDLDCPLREAGLDQLIRPSEMIVAERTGAVHQ